MTASVSKHMRTAFFLFFPPEILELTVDWKSTLLHDLIGSHVYAQIQSLFLKQLVLYYSARCTKSEQLLKFSLKFEA